jgi:hypothetical protein
MDSRVIVVGSVLCGVAYVVPHALDSHCVAVETLFFKQQQ